MRSGAARRRRDAGCSTDDRHLRRATRHHRQVRAGDEESCAAPTTWPGTSSERRVLVFNGYFANADLRQVTEGSISAARFRWTIRCPPRSSSPAPARSRVSRSWPSQPASTARPLHLSWPLQSISVLEGLHAQKKISRSDEFSYQSAEQPRRPTPRGFADRADDRARGFQTWPARRSITTETICDRDDVTSQPQQPTPPSPSGERVKRGSTGKSRRRSHRAVERHAVEQVGLGIRPVMKYRYSKFRPEDLDGVDPARSCSSSPIRCLERLRQSAWQSVMTMRTGFRARRCTTRSWRRC